MELRRSRKPILGLSDYGVTHFQMDNSATNPQYQMLLNILVEQRMLVGMTQADVARTLKKPQSFVSKYEHGERRLDIIETINLCKILNLSPQKLLLELIKGQK